MSRRNYDQSCGLATALDRIGERWSLLIVRELALGPLRFSDLARAVGGAPTDVLTRRLRDLERDGVVRRRRLDPPASGLGYELTDLGRGLERPYIELARWGLNFLQVENAEDLDPGLLPNAMRVLLQPPGDLALTVALRSGGREYGLRIADGWIEARRGAPDAADLTLTGTPRDILVALAEGEEGVEVEGDRAALASLRAAVVVPDDLREAALATIAEQASAARVPA
jgi:DNA-binding HxlR family transcriptional regulator